MSSKLLSSQKTTAATVIERESPYIYHGPSSIHDNSFNMYEAGASNPNTIRQRIFKPHYRHAFIEDGESEVSAKKATQSKRNSHQELQSTFVRS